MVYSWDWLEMEGTQGIERRSTEVGVDLCAPVTGTSRTSSMMASSSWVPGSGRDRSSQTSRRTTEIQRGRMEVASSLVFDGQGTEVSSCFFSSVEEEQQRFVALVMLQIWSGDI
jgi:hypothetical protein